MQPHIKTISLALPYRLGSVNCYLVSTDAGFVLIDTGSSNARADLESELENAGCGPGNLELIILTHGDFDHSGNAAYLRSKYGTKIAMDQDDSGMVERGDMFWNRKSRNFPGKVIARLLPFFFRFGVSERFEPDLTVGDGYDLSAYGFDARVLEIPGHSKGSIGVLTSGGALFCGDLLENTDRPALHSIMDDTAEANVSVSRLRNLQVGDVYPGHGGPFRLESLDCSATLSCSK